MNIIKEKKIFRDFIFWPTIIVVFLLDQLSKNIVTNIFKGGKIWPEESPIRLAYVTNTGSAFGLFQNATLFLTIASIIGICFLIYLYYYYNAKSKPMLRFALGLMVGGALGNLFDRIYQGYVVDFIGFWWWPWFNIADSSVSVGTFILITVLFIFDKPKKEQNKIKWTKH
ncbi:MAG: signal peptidase II [Chloroflexi bacterium]|nr:signal peptidase II [Chloroflexota bacterium]|tara:strand:+ start:244 stop:753 length:510 start_codon:yes stop_codon:yes gene_type:complete